MSKPYCICDNRQPRVSESFSGEKFFICDNCKEEIQPDVEAHESAGDLVSETGLQVVVPEISVHVEPDALPVRGNAMASGDDDYDKPVEDKILADMEDNVWAWACVEVRASYGGLTCSDYLGACSYKDEEDFVKNSGYYEDMVKEACAQLAFEVRNLQGVRVCLPDGSRA